MWKVRVFLLDKCGAMAKYVHLRHVYIAQLFKNSTDGAQKHIV